MEVGASESERLFAFKKIKAKTIELTKGIKSHGVLT